MTTAGGWHWTRAKGWKPGGNRTGSSRTSSRVCPWAAARDNPDWLTERLSSAGLQMRLSLPPWVGTIVTCARRWNTHERKAPFDWTGVPTFQRKPSWPWSRSTTLASTVCSAASSFSSSTRICKQAQQGQKIDNTVRLKNDLVTLLGLVWRCKFPSLQMHRVYGGVAPFPICAILSTPSTPCKIWQWMQ